jgi:hypothetical protein
MRVNIPWKWEELDIWTDRAKVIGGWLVRSMFADNGESIVFINDPDHRWTITPREEPPCKTSTNLR